MGFFDLLFKKNNDLKNQYDNKLKAIKTLLKQYNLDLDVENLTIVPDYKLKLKDTNSEYNRLLDEIFDDYKNKKFENKPDIHKLKEDLDKLYYESPIIGKAMQIVADELLQTTSGMPLITVTSDDDAIKKELENLFKKINIEKILSIASLELSRYGNSFFVILYNYKDGVYGLEPIPLTSVKKIYKFRPFELKNAINDYRSDNYNSVLRDLVLNDEKLKKLYDLIVNKEEDYEYLFKTYLFGYLLENDILLLPWRILHFKNAKDDIEFDNFGVPLFINSLAPYKEYDLNMSLIMAARKTKLPLMNYKVKLPPNLSPTEKLDRAIEFLRELENYGLDYTRREGLGLGERIVTIEDLYTIEDITPQIDLGRLDDLNLLKEDLYASAFVPRGFLDPNDQTASNSSIALKQQFVPFSRMILRFQLILLDQLNELCKIHLILKNHKNYNNFILSMPYPETQYSTELLTSINQSLETANAILNSLSEKFGITSTLPPELVFKIYSHFLPIHNTELTKWFLDFLYASEYQKVLNSKGIQTPNIQNNENMFGGSDLFGGGGLFGNTMEQPIEQNIEQPNEQPTEQNEQLETLKQSFYYNLKKYLPKNKKQLKLLLEKKELTKYSEYTIIKESLDYMNQNYLKTSNKIYYKNSNESSNLYLFKKFEENKIKLALKEMKKGGLNE